MRDDQAALVSRMLGGSAMRAALNSGPMTPVATGKQLDHRSADVVSGNPDLEPMVGHVILGHAGFRQT